MAQVKWDEVNVLVAEDEEDLREILVHVFENEGSHVHSAKDGKEACHILTNHPIDVVLSDVRMPKCDGIQLLEAIRKVNPDNPVVFLATGFADLNEEQAIEKGAASLITKPFSIEDLFSVLESHLLKNANFKKVM
jgi:CheY-like chemotaxis protein